MLGPLFRNVALSAAAFFVVSVVGLLLVPVLIAKYGLAGFGHVAVARLFVPVAALAVLDFGFGEIATQAVARARANGDWQRCARLLTLASVGSVGVGAAAGIGLFVASPWIPGWMSIAAADRPGLTGVLVATSVAMPLLFLSLVCEGIVKGFESYLAQRGIEVLSALSYAGLTLGAIWTDRDVNVVCYALLISLVLRALVAGAVAVHSLNLRGIRPARSLSDDRSHFYALSRVMAANKVLGATQSQSPPLLIGVFFGPLAVGTYDALNRLPRFAKGVLGTLSSTVLPVATRLDSVADNKGLRRLGQTGVLVIGLVSLPPLAAAITFSEPILRLWIGASLSTMWQWQAALFLVPAASVLVGFGATALLGRPHVVSMMNRLVALQIALQLTISVVAGAWLRELGFVLGQVTAVLLTFVLQMRQVNTELGVPGAANWRLLRMLGVTIALGVPGALLAGRIHSWSSLALGSVGWLIACWAACYFVVMSAEQRRKLREAVKARLSR